MKKILSILIALITLFSLPAFADGAYQPGDRAEDFTVTLADGTSVALSQLLSGYKLVVLDFFVPQCAPCEQVLPLLKQNAAAHAGDVAILCVCPPLVTEEEFSACCAALAPDEYTLLARDSDGSLTQLFLTDPTYPTTVLIDRNGIICLRHTGFITDTACLAELFDLYTAEPYETTVQEDISSHLCTVSMENNYIIWLTDEAALPLSGVMFRVCDDTTCRILTTDENGFALLENDGKTYEVHFLTTPEGYTPVSDAYTLGPDDALLPIHLSKTNG